MARAISRCMVSSKNPRVKSPVKASYLANLEARSNILISMTTGFFSTFLTDEK